MKRTGFVTLLLLAVVSQAFAGIPTGERDALIAFYNATGGPNWTNKANWLGAPGTECTWFGVRCVMVGTMESVVGLEFRNYPGNNLTGTIPTSITGLPNLTDLILWEENMSGPIPKEIGMLTKLEYFDFEPYSYQEYGTGADGALPRELGNLSNLRSLYLFGNFSGALPPEIGNLTNLTGLSLWSGFTGEIPSSYAALNKLTSLSLYGSLTGPLPSFVSGMTGMLYLYLYGSFTGDLPDYSALKNLKSLGLVSPSFQSGPIPSWIATLSALEGLYMSRSNRIGEIPSFLGNMPTLKYLSIYSNPFTPGPVPSWIPQLTGLQTLDLEDTKRTGEIPRALGSMSALRTVWLNRNDLTGAIPAELGQLANLRFLHLGNNRLTGEIPATFGNLQELASLYLYSNGLTGQFPAAVANLTKLTFLDAGYNALNASDPALLATLTAKSRHDFLSRQTIPPADVKVDKTDPTSATISWTPRGFLGEPGGFQVLASQCAVAPCTNYKVALTTTSKSAKSATITGLNPSTAYSFILRMVSYASGQQKNSLTSENSAAVSATTQAKPPTPAQVVIVSLPSALLQAFGTSGQQTSYVLQNVGEIATTITMQQDGNFFTQSPSSFALAGGATQTITITAAQQPAAGSYNGVSRPTGTGVPSGMTIPVSLLVAAPPAGPVTAAPTTNRVDVSASESQQTVTGTAQFKNTSANPLTGIVVSDVPWIIPPSGTVTIAPGETITITFTIDRSKRPDADAVVGSVSGKLILVFFTSSGSGKQALNGTPPTGSATVSITDTSRPPVTQVGVPVLGAGEVALFVPGIGSVEGSVGKFVTDLILTHREGAGSIDNLKMYFTAAGSPSSASFLSQVARLQANRPASMYDLVSTIFQKPGTSGTLQIRVSDTRTPIDTISVNANVFNASNSAGTYGSVVPVLRSDRGVAPGQSLYLVGLMKHATDSHTNMIIQEVRGAATTVHIDMIAENGSPVGDRRSFPLEPFASLRINDAVPLGAVAATLTNDSSSQGRFLAFATPVDKAPGGGDTWVVADWSRLHGYALSEPVIIPVAGLVRGANNTYFRTDLAFLNPRGATSTAKIRFYPDAGSVIERSISLPARNAKLYLDVMGTLFGMEGRALGYLVVVPDEGSSFAVNSRTYATTGSAIATFGTGVPAIALSGGIRIGQTRRIGGIDDAHTSTIAAAKPASFRTNLGLVETDGKNVKVRVTVHYASLFSGSTVTTRGSASREYDLPPYGFRLISNVSREVIGAALRETLGDLKNLQVDITVVDGEGSLTVFSSSVDNGTGDQVLRTE